MRSFFLNQRQNESHRTIDFTIDSVLQSARLVKHKHDLQQWYILQLYADGPDIGLNDESNLYCIFNK